jgi:hypothetical protein
MNETTPAPLQAFDPTSYRPTMGDVLRIESKGQQHDAEVFEIAPGNGFGVKWESGRHPKAAHLPGLWRTYFNQGGSPKYDWKIVGIVKLARADSPTCEVCGGYGYITINAEGDEGSCGACYETPAPVIDTVSGPVELEAPSLESAEKMVRSAIPFDDDFGDVELGPACKLGDTECESCS